MDNKIVDQSDVVRASPVGTAPITSLFSAQHLASMVWAKTTSRRDEKHWGFGIWCVLYQKLDGNSSTHQGSCTRLMNALPWVAVCYFWFISLIYPMVTSLTQVQSYFGAHDDVIKWKHFPRHGPFVWGIHRWPVNSPHKGQWRGALMFPLIWAWTKA